MAQVKVIKEGGEGKDGGAQAGDAHAVAMETLVDKLTPFEKRYFDAPPDATARIRADHEQEHVLVKVDEAEINAVFPKEGYYLIPELTGEDCRRLFGFAR